MKPSKKHDARRAGFAAAMPNDDGDVLLVLYGPLYVLDPTAYKAELYGVVRVAENCLPPITVYLDCLSVVETYRRGKAFCCSSQRQAADLWRRLWAVVEEFGCDGTGAPLMQLRWLKGHATQSHIDKGIATAWGKKSTMVWTPLPGVARV